MTINTDIKKIIVNIKNKKLITNKDIIKTMNISNGSIYDCIHEYKNKFINNNNRNSKITNDIKCYIRYYVINRINFN